MASAEGGVGTNVVVVVEFLFPDAAGDTVRNGAPAPLNVPLPEEAAAAGLVAVPAPLKPGGGRGAVPVPVAAALLLLLLLLLLFKEVDAEGLAAAAAVAARDCNGLLQAFCGGCDSVVFLLLPLSVDMLLFVLLKQTEQSV